MAGFVPYQLVKPTDLNNILSGTPYSSFVINWDGVSPKEGTIELKVIGGSFGNIIIQSNSFATGDINIQLPNSSGTLLSTGDLEVIVSDSITTTEFFLNNANLNINTETGVFGLVSLVASTIDTQTLTAQTVVTDVLEVNGWLFEVI